MSLCLQIEVQERLPLTNFKGSEVGQLTVEALPCLQDGSLLVDNEVFVEDPTELIGKPLHFLLKIKDATGLPSRFSKVRMYVHIRTVHIKDNVKWQGGGHLHNTYIHTYMQMQC